MIGDYAMKEWIDQNYGRTEQTKPKEVRIKVDDIILIEKLLNQKLSYEEIYKFIEISDKL
jgi:hypothetical protein